MENKSDNEEAEQAGFKQVSSISGGSRSRQPEKTLMTQDQEKSPAAQVMKLAAVEISQNVRLRSSDMPLHMQQHALRCTTSFLDHNSSSSDPNKHRPNPTHLARALKKEFDSVYGPAWHCVVGKSFGSFVTHSSGGFIYFSIDSLFILLFKTQVQLVGESEPSSIS